MHKSLLIASFAVLTASVFGMNPDYHGESSNRSGHNQLLRDIKRENPTETNISTESPQENSQSNEINGNNLISSMLKILSENDILKSEVRDKDAEIQKLTQGKDAKIQELRDKLTFVQQRLIKANNDVFNKFYEKSPRKRSRSVEEEEIQREFEFLHSNKLRNVISQNNEAIAEYKSKQESLKAENQELKTLLKDTATELKKIQNLQTENENTHQKEKEAREFENQRLVKTNQEKDKRIENFQNQENNLKRKLDEANQEITELKKQRAKNLKAFKDLEKENQEKDERISKYHRLFSDKSVVKIIRRYGPELRYENPYF